MFTALTSGVLPVSPAPVVAVKTRPPAAPDAAAFRAALYTKGLPAVLAG